MPPDRSSIFSRPSTGITLDPSFVRLKNKWFSLHCLVLSYLVFVNR